MQEIFEKNRIISTDIPSDSNKGTVSANAESARAYASDYTSFLRNGTVSDTLSRKSDPAGGYLIPESLSEMIAEKLASTNILRRIGHVFHTEGTTRVPVAVGGIDGYWVPEEGQMTLSQPEFSSHTFEAYKLAAMALVSCELLHDSAYNQYFSGFQRSVDTVWKERTRKQLKNTQAMKLKAAEAEVERLQKQEGILRQEVMKSLMGESSYDTELLKSMLEENKLALAGAESVLTDCRQEKESSDAQLKRLSEQYDHIVDWAKEFDAADNDAKKMILAKLIERIEVDRNDNVCIMV